MIRVLLAAIPVACIAWTVTQEDIFKELRTRLCRIRDNKMTAWWCRKLAYIPTCTYCFSHYVAAVVVFAYGVTLLSTGWRGEVAALFAVVAVANVYITVYHGLRLTLKCVRLYSDRLADAGATENPVWRRPAA